MVYYVMYFIETSLGVLMCREEINKIMNVLILIIICLYKQQLNTYYAHLVHTTHLDLMN